jgi:hypothetical protein
VLWKRVAEISLVPGASSFRASNGREYLLEEEQRGDDEVRWWRLALALLGGVCELAHRENGFKASRAASLAREAPRIVPLARNGCPGGGAEGLAAREEALFCAAAAACVPQPVARARPTTASPKPAGGARDRALRHCCSSGGPLRRAPLGPVAWIALVRRGSPSTHMHSLHTTGRAEGRRHPGGHRRGRQQLPLHVS